MVLPATRRALEHIPLLPTGAACAFHRRLQPQRATWRQLGGSPEHHFLRRERLPCRHRLCFFDQLPEVAAVIQEDVVARMAGHAAGVLLKLGQADELE